jgi:hypothetical protein
MKKSQLRKLVRECVLEVIKEEEAAAEIPKAVSDADSEMTKLAKLVKKLPDDLKAKLAKKVKTAQGDVNSYIDSLKSKEDKNESFIREDIDDATKKEIKVFLTTYKNEFITDIPGIKDAGSEYEFESNSEIPKALVKASLELEDGDEDDGVFGINIPDPPGSSTLNRIGSLSTASGRISNIDIYI